MQKLRWQWKVCERGVIAQRLDRFDYHKLANPWPKPRCHLSHSGTNRRWVLSASKKHTTPTPDRCVKAAPIPPAPFFQSKHMGTFPPRSRMAITQMEIPNCKSDRMCEFMRSGARAPFGCPRCPHCPRCQSFHGCRQRGGEVRGAPCSTSLCVGYPLLPMFSPEAWPTHPRLL